MDEENNLNLANIGPQNTDTSSHARTEKRKRDQDEIEHVEKRFKDTSR